MRKGQRSKIKLCPAVAGSATNTQIEIQKNTKEQWSMIKGYRTAGRVKNMGKRTTPQIGYWLGICLLLNAVTFGATVHSLYTDHRAMKVDDILTVFIVEEAKAGSKTGTNTSKENEMGVNGLNGSGALDFLPSFGASGGFKNAYKGNAGTSREGSLAARVSARVIKVLDNGNLMIEGSKIVEINEEREIIKISGIVRPQDIEADNIIYSHNVADAEITYSGKGTVHKGHRPGLVTKFLNWLF